MGIMCQCQCRGLTRDMKILRIWLVGALISFLVLIGGAVWAFTTIDYAKQIRCTVVDRSVTRSTFSKCTETINYEYHYKVQFAVKAGGLLKMYNTTACYGGTPCYYSYGPSCSAEMCPLPVKCKTEIQTKIDDFVRTPLGTVMTCYYHDNEPMFLQYGDVVPWEFHYPTLGLIIPGFVFTVVFFLAWRTKRQEIKSKEEELPLSADPMVDSGYQVDGLYSDGTPIANSTASIVGGSPAAIPSSRSIHSTHAFPADEAAASSSYQPPQSAQRLIGDDSDDDDNDIDHARRPHDDDDDPRRSAVSTGDRF